jgi:hypothetical protein
MNTKRLPMAEWLYRWLNENPTATIEEGLKAFESNKEVLDLETKLQEISDKEIWIKANTIGHSYNSSIAAQFFYEGAKWYREQLKSRQ